MYSINFQFKDKKQCYFKLFNLVNKILWLQILLCIKKNLIKHQSFIYTLLRGSLNKFSDFFRMATFIDSTHMKL